MAAGVPLRCAQKMMMYCGSAAGSGGYMQGARVLCHKLHAWDFLLLSSSLYPVYTSSRRAVTLLPERRGHPLCKERCKSQAGCCR